MIDTADKFPNTPEGHAQAMRVAGDVGFWEQFVDWSSDEDGEAAANQAGFADERMLIQALAETAGSTPEAFAPDDLDTIAALAREQGIEVIIDTPDIATVDQPPQMV